MSKPPAKTTTKIAKPAAAVVGHEPAVAPKAATRASGGRKSAVTEIPGGAISDPPAQSAAMPLTHGFADRFGPARRPVVHPEPMNPVKTVTKADPKLVNAWKTKAGRDLTEAELLAMPDSEYMNDKQIDYFRACLQGQKDDLLSNAGETTEHLREDTTIVPDPADRATIEEEHALELRTRDRERKLLKKISQALSRLDTGEYGYCDETGEPIGLPRLLARPTATLSLEAQQRRELKQKMFGD